MVGRPVGRNHDSLGRGLVSTSAELRWTAIAEQPGSGSQNQRVARRSNRRPGVSASRSGRARRSPAPLRRRRAFLSPAPIRRLPRQEGGIAPGERFLQRRRRHVLWVLFKTAVNGCLRAGSARTVEVLVGSTPNSRHRSWPSLLPPPSPRPRRCTEWPSLRARSLRAGPRPDVRGLHDSIEVTLSINNFSCSSLL